MENGKQPMYPRTAFDQAGDITTWNDEFKGLTKREYFAAMAIQGLLTKYSLSNPGDQEIVAKLSVELSDELLKQLESND